MVNVQLSKVLLKRWKLSVIGERLEFRYNIGVWGAQDFEPRGLGVVDFVYDSRAYGIQILAADFFEFI